MENRVEQQKESLNLREKISPFKNLEETRKGNGLYEFSLPLFGIGNVTFTAEAGALGNPTKFLVSCSLRLAARLKPGEEERWKKFIELAVKTPQNKMLFASPRLENYDNETMIRFNSFSSAAQQAEHSRTKTPGTAPNSYIAHINELPELTFVFDSKAQGQEILMT